MPQWAIVASRQRRRVIATWLDFCRWRGRRPNGSTWHPTRLVRGRGTLVGPQRKTRVDFLAGQAVSVANTLGGSISEM